MASPYGGWNGKEKYRYEIATIAIDGTSQVRLTENEYLDHYPVWSPDGTRIAFVANPQDPVSDEGQLFTMSGDGSGVARALTAPAIRTALYPPVWSPDGHWLAFTANEGEYHPFERVLYTVRADGSELSRIANTTALPTWSPDSQRVAFARNDGGETGIYTVGSDGTDPVQMWRGEADAASPPISLVSWSPDGSDILFVSDGLHVVPSDGSAMGRLPITGWRFAVIGSIVQAAWSPDGARIAIHYRDDREVDHQLLTMARDGTDVRLLARGNDSGRLQAWHPPRQVLPVDLSACSAGLVVPEPKENPGLVQDCEALLSIRDTLAGSAILNWSGRTPIGEWEGITVGGLPLRVHGMVLRSRGLTGRLPPEFSQLTELRKLDLAGWNGDPAPNGLTGPIPPELGDLTELEVLDLRSNYLTGGIPSEFDGLVNLKRLALSFNLLNGNVPAELGSLPNLLNVDLSYNMLSGSIPPELSAIVKLRHFYLGWNQLSGGIPPELGRLKSLSSLHLERNNLSWSIPSELGRILNLHSVSIIPNNIGGCISAELPDIWVGQSRLKRCEPAETVSP